MFPDIFSSACIFNVIFYSNNLFVCEKKLLDKLNSVIKYLLLYIKFRQLSLLSCGQKIEF